MKFLSISIFTIIIVLNGYSDPLLTDTQNSDIEKNYKQKEPITDYEKGINFIKEKNYTAALDILKPLAENNDPKSQFQLGNLYNKGNNSGIEFDANKSSYWYDMAFKLNNQIVSNNRLNFFSKDSDLVTEAYNGIGNAYNSGHGVERDWNEARSWYMKAAENGHPNGQYWVGHYYLTGTTGYPKISYFGIQSYEKAFYWFQKAALQGHAEAQYELGLIYGFQYKKIKEIPVDKEKAFFWWMKSAEQNYSEPYIHIAKSYLNGTGVEQDFKKAAYWYDKSEKDGHYWAKGKAELIKKELIERQERAENGDAKAQYELGCIFYNDYINGRNLNTGVEHNYNKAMDWFKKAAKQNYLSAIEFGRLFFMSNFGTVDDFKEGFFYFSKAANEGNAEAQYILSQIYAGDTRYIYPRYNETREKFILTVKNNELHLFWLKKAAEQGNEKALKKVSKFNHKNNRYEM